MSESSKSTPTDAKVRSESFVGPIDHAVKEVIARPDATLDDAFDFAVGAIFRQGTLKSASGRYTPAVALGTIQAAAEERIEAAGGHIPETEPRDLKTKTDFLTKIPRAQGLREAFAAIHAKGGDEAIGKMRDISSRLRIDTEDQPVLSNMNQFAGYLGANSSGYRNTTGLDWQQALLDAVQARIFTPGDSIPAAWESDHLRGSEIPGQAAAQNQWNQALREARRAGVDIDFVTHSADQLHDLTARAAVEVGSIALGRDVLMARSIQETVHGPATYTRP